MLLSKSNQMIKLWSMISCVVLLLLGCSNSEFRDTESTTYVLTDSVICHKNISQSTSVEMHHPMNREITILKTISTGELEYNAKKYVMYAEGKYNGIEGSFPLLHFEGDSITLSAHIGGVNFQIWNNIKGTKK
jgi:hypothetical protein